jgi:hypothetical protein
VWADKADYTQVTTGALTAASGSGTTFVGGAIAPTGPNTVSVDAVNTDYIVLGGRSNSGSCFYVADDTTVGTTYAKMGGSGGCSANGAPLPGDPAWKPKW